MKSQLILLFLAACSIFVARGMGQDTKPCDSSVKFVDRNMIDYTIQVRAIHGTITDAWGQPAYKGCVALFQSDRATLLRTVEADDDGNFEIKGLKAGDYWLVVQDGQRAFCPSTTRLKLSWHARKSRLIVHMKPAGIDTCSYCEAK